MFNHEGEDKWEGAVLNVRQVTLMRVNRSMVLNEYESHSD